LVNIKTAKTYTDLFEPELIEIEGCVYIKDSCGINRVPANMDSVGKECFFHHIHIFDEFSHKAGLEGENDLWYDTEHPDFEIAWQLACIIGRHWSYFLRKEFPVYEFRVYCTKYDDPIVRFHVVRENQSNWMEDSQINDGVVIYKSICL